MTSTGANTINVGGSRSENTDPHGGSNEGYNNVTSAENLDSDPGCQDPDAAGGKAAAGLVTGESEKGSQGLSLTRTRRGLSATEGPLAPAPTYECSGTCGPTISEENNRRGGEAIAGVDAAFASGTVSTTEDRIDEGQGTSGVTSNKDYTKN